MNTAGNKMMMLLFVIGIGAILFFSSQYELPRSGESRQGGLRELQGEFINRLYENDGIEKNEPFVAGGEEGVSLLGLENNDQSLTDQEVLFQTKQEKAQNLLDEKSEGLLWSNLEQEGDLITLYLRGVLTYTDTGIYEQGLFEGLADILVTEESQDLVVYRNGRPELFNRPNDQSGICLPEKDDLELLGDFTQETGIFVEDVERFEIRRWFKRELVVRVADMNMNVFEADLVISERSINTEEYSLDCSRASVGVFDVGEWVGLNVSSLQNLDENKSDSEVSSSEDSA